MAEYRYWKIPKGQAERLLCCATSFCLVRRHVGAKYEPEVVIRQRNDGFWMVVVDESDLLNSDGTLESIGTRDKKNGIVSKRNNFSLKTAWELAEKFAIKNNLSINYKG